MLLEEAERIDREEIAAKDEDAEGRWIFVRPRRAKEPSQIYSLRLPVSVVEQIRVVAASRGEAPTALLRDWVLEHLDDALKDLWKSPPRSAARKKESRTSGRAGGASRSKAGLQATSTRRGSTARKTETKTAAKE